MTILHIHLAMLGLGFLVYLFVAGVFRNRKSYNRRLRRQWWLGATAGLIVALAPFSYLWRRPPNNIDFLVQSLIVAVIGLLALLIYALLSRPRKSRLQETQEHEKSTSHSTEKLASGLGGAGVIAGLAPIVIDADTQPVAKAAEVHTKQSGVVTVDRSALQSKSDAESSDRQAGSTITDAQDESGKPGVPLEAGKSTGAGDIAHTVGSATAKSESDVKTDNTSSTALPAITSRSNERVADINSKTSSRTQSEEASQSIDQQRTHKLHLDEVASAMSLQSPKTRTRQVDEKYSHATAANDTAANAGDNALFDNRSSETVKADDTLDIEPEFDESDIIDRSTHTGSNKSVDLTDAASGNIDLSESEQLFAQIRQQSVEVELPDDDELRRANAAASIEELDLEESVVEPHDVIEATPTTACVDQPVEPIEEAEVVAVEEQPSLAFGNDLTGEYAHPDTETGAEYAGQNDRIDEVVLPETLDEAIVAAKIGAVSLQSQVSILEQSIGELTILRDKTVTAAKSSREQQLNSLEQKDELSECSDSARRAAEAVITAQSELIENTKRQQVQIKQLLQQERRRLRALEQEITRSRKMARSAALLARRAAVAQQEIKVVAHREKTARLKSQESTRKAVDIARNAISALAAEERKRGVTRH